MPDRSPSSQSRPALRCWSCGRFVAEERAHWHIEYGDYGTVHSAEVECENCAGDYGYDPDFAPGGPASVLPAGYA
jgi:hypothetical protein